MAKFMQKGISREEIQQQSLQRRQQVLEFIEKHGRVTMTQIETETQFTRSVLFKWLRKMREDGHVNMETEMAEHKRGKQSHGVHPVNFYSRGPNTSPLYAFEHGSASPSVVADMPIKRKIVKHWVADCRRDDLVAALFGEAQAVA